MRIRVLLAPTVALSVAMCGGDTAREPEMSAGQEPAAESETVSAAEAALDALPASYEEAYNRHDAAAVAAMFADSAVMLSADGGVLMGKEAILASLQEDMAGSPQVTIDQTDTRTMGEYAAGRGSYTLRTTPEGGEPIEIQGNYLSLTHMENGEWKIMGLTTNTNAAPPEGMPQAEAPAEAPPDNGTMQDVLNAYQQAFNAGDAAGVAAVYTEDGVMAFSNLPVAEGRAAIQSAVEQRFAMGSPQLTIHDVGTGDFGNGWAADGGWYELKATSDEGEITQAGSYMLLLQQDDTGAWKVVWGISNGQPTPAM